MGDRSHRRPVLVTVAGAVLLAAACSGGDGDPAGDGGSRSDAQVVRPAAERCDRAFNTADYNEAAPVAEPGHTAHGAGSDGAAAGEVRVDFTLEDWAEIFTDGDLGMSVDEVVDAVAADDIYRRHVLGGVLTHTLEADPWTPMGDGEACAALAAELREARAVGARYPTVGDALAAGYVRGDSYFAGLGVHFQDWNRLGAFDPGRPVQLLYDGTEPGAHLVGLSYVVRAPGEAPPEGFTGDNDVWHRHSSFCLDDEAVNLSADVLSEAECAALGGTHVTDSDGWMLHAWLVPGCESDWGLFSAANPRLPFRPDGTGFASGCNSGKVVADAIEFDASGDGPVIDSP